MILVAALDADSDFAAASAVAIDEPGRGVELLDQGRGMLWADALAVRSDLAALATHAPELASRLAAVRNALDANGRWQSDQST